MTISSQLPVLRLPQLQHFNDAVRCQREYFLYRCRQLFFVYLSCSEGIYQNRNRMCNADCISKLYFATVCQISSYNILCNIPCCIRCGTVYLRWVFTAECTAAVTSRTAISIYNNLSTSQTAVTLWATNDKPTSRVDIILRVFVQHFRRQYWSMT